MTDAVDVIDPESGDPVPWDAETMGEIVIRGNTVMKGYLKDADATAESFQNGWFMSGDIAVVHPDGYIQVKDRAKDVIISGGENISSVEVEGVLYRHPAVGDAAVVALADDRNLALSLGQRNRHRVAQHFTLDGLFSAYAELYRTPDQCHPKAS